MEDFQVRQLDRKGYEIRGLLGTGATSEVFCVREKKTGFRYACKISRQTGLLELEAELMHCVRHPVYPKEKDFWIGQGYAFLVMEYIEGSSLKEYLEAQGRLCFGETMRIMLALTEGLAYLQEQSSWMVYKDLKPANIMIARTGEVRLLDLGAAGVKSGWRIGTPGYSAPELLRKKDAASCASDVYSLGILMYRMLTGKIPSPGHGGMRNLHRVRMYRWDVPFGIKLILERCVRQEPGERIPDARTLYFLLSDYYEAGCLGLLGLELRAFFHRKWNKQLIFEKNIYKKRS